MCEIAVLIFFLNFLLFFAGCGCFLFVVVVGFCSGGAVEEHSHTHTHIESSSHVKQPNIHDTRVL